MRGGQGKEEAKERAGSKGRGEGRQGAKRGRYGGLGWKGELEVWEGGT